MTEKSKKPRKLTEREKKERAKIREQLRAEGLLPPVKKPLNHKKFIEEAKELYETENLYDLFAYICWGLAEMMNHGRGDKEAIGAAKALLLAKRRKEFEEERRAQGLTNTYKVGELCEAVEEIYNA